MIALLMRNPSARTLATRGMSSREATMRVWKEPLSETVRLSFSLLARDRPSAGVVAGNTGSAKTRPRNHG